jgi:deazaflavin-dependent oxidoreductase (nitroreductase family)
VTHRRAGPILTRLLGAPVRLYDWHAGWILGRRFLRLTHVGRRTGRAHQTMLEVVREDHGRNEVTVVAGFGRSAQWYRNLLAGKAIEVAIGHERFAPQYREVGADEAAAVLEDYERRNRFVAPVIRRVLSWLVGWNYDGTPVNRRRLASELPMVALRPKGTTDALV